MSSCKILSMLGDAFTPDDRGVAWRARWLADDFLNAALLHDHSKWQ